MRPAGLQSAVTCGMIGADPHRDGEVPMTGRRVTILGVPVDDIDESEALRRAHEMLRAGGPHQICTVNPEFIMTAQQDAGFRAVLSAADLCTPDGIGLLWAARRLGTPLRTRVTGVELTVALAGLAAREQLRLFLLGAAPGVAEQAAAVLQTRFPGLMIAGTFAGSPADDDAEQLCRMITAARPQILLVAFGHPRQDLWIARHQPRLRVPLAMGVGGTFDYLAGRVPRAPRLLRRLGLEWAYRLFMQPARWRRIIDAVPRFAFAVLRNGRPAAPSA
jgi:N-acetylglucosaminyldiphosphoundecaprenol N-acetyl-beta-D-mannosaminyltransferase